MVAFPEFGTCVFKRNTIFIKLIDSSISIKTDGSRSLEKIPEGNWVHDEAMVYLSETYHSYITAVRESALTAPIFGGACILLLAFCPLPLVSRRLPFLPRSCLSPLVTCLLPHVSCFLPPAACLLSHSRLLSFSSKGFYLLSLCSLHPA